MYTEFPGLALAAYSFSVPILPFCCMLLQVFGVHYFNKVCFVVIQKWNLALSKSWVPLEVCFLANANRTTPQIPSTQKQREKNWNTRNNARNTLWVLISRTENLNHLHKSEQSIKESVCAVPCVGALLLVFSVISLCHALSYPHQWHFVVKQWFKLCHLF